MSKNPMKLKVWFENEINGNEVEAILKKAKKWMDEDYSEERWLNDYLSKNGLDEGIPFDSFLYPEVVEGKGSFLRVDFIGSPGEDLSGDVVAWLKKKGAKSIKGSLFISGAGEKIDINY